MIVFKRFSSARSTVRAAGILIVGALFLGACHVYVPVPGPRVVIGSGYHGHYGGHYGYRGHHGRHGHYRHY